MATPIFLLDHPRSGNYHRHNGHNSDRDHRDYRYRSGKDRHREQRVDSRLQAGGQGKITTKSRQR